MNKIVTKIGVILVIIGLVGSAIVITVSIPYFITIINNYSESINI